MAESKMSIPRIVFVVTLVLLVVQSMYWAMAGEQLYGGALYWPTIASWLLSGIGCMIDRATERVIRNEDFALGRAVVKLAAAQAEAAPAQQYVGHVPTQR